MVDYPNEILGLINSLENPRYGNQDAPHLAPVLFDGMLQNARVTFLATSDDPHDYGVQVWTDAQAGKYGVIKPYTPPVYTPPPPPPGEPPVNTLVAAYNRLVMQVLPNEIVAAAVERTATLLTQNGGHIPSGAKGAAISSLAETCHLSIDSFLAFVRALDDLKFEFLAALARFTNQASTDDAARTFASSMAQAVAAFNAVSPTKIESTP